MHYHGDMSSDARMLSVKAFSAAAGEAGEDGEEPGEPGPLVMARRSAPLPPAAILRSFSPSALEYRIMVAAVVSVKAFGFLRESQMLISSCSPRPALLPQVCTDLAARGLDFGCRVDHIVNFDFPRSNVDYLHRAGRTARAGAKGDITSLVGKRDKPVAAAVEELVKAGGALEGEKKAKAKVVRARVGPGAAGPGRRGAARVGGPAGGGPGGGKKFGAGGRSAGAYSAAGGRGGARGAGRPAGGAGGRSGARSGAGAGGAGRKAGAGAGGGGGKW